MVSRISSPGAVVGQQLSTKAARSIWRRVEGSAESSGMRIPGFFEEGNEGVLRACGVSKNKVRTLLGVREAEAIGLLDRKKVRWMDHRSRANHLMAMWGLASGRVTGFPSSTAEIMMCGPQGT